MKRFDRAEWIAKQAEKADIKRAAKSVQALESRVQTLERRPEKDQAGAAPGRTG
jgi:hypothetical protein